MRRMVELVDVPVPEGPGSPGWDAFVAFTEIENATQVAAYGTRDVEIAAAELLPHYRDPHEEVRWIAAREGDRIVGRISVQRTLEAPETGFAELQVRPGHERRGIGRALADRLDALAAELALTKLITYVPSAPGDAGDERLVPPTGAGSVSLADRGTRFLLARGWRLEQVERGSRFALPADPAALASLRADAEEHAAGYRLHTWIGLTPEPMRDGMAELMARMTTDAPTAGLEEPPETWDAARVLENETRLSEGRDFVTTVAEHTASGRLAGMTWFSVPAGSAPVRQWDTIVRAEDRGHRLGMLLKAANLQALQERFPGRPSVVTWNAEENRHMLAVNEAIGFVPMGYDGAWRKDLG
jgi:GNAT superfamily N-acetyltransferase